MSEENTTDNLRRFLESDDPAKVLMGLSMAKGTGVDESLLGLVLALSVYAEDEKISEVAEEVFAQNAPADLGDFLTLIRTDKEAAVQRLVDHGSAVVPTLVAVLEMALDRVSRHMLDWQHDFCSVVVVALGKLRDERAIQPVIRVLQHWWTGEYLSRPIPEAKTALLQFGAAAVEPLIAALEEPFDSGKYLGHMVPDVLGEIGDSRSVEPLIRRLIEQCADKSEWHELSLAYTEALLKLADQKPFDQRAIDLLKGAGGSWTSLVLARLGLADAAAIEKLVRHLWLPSLSGGEANFGESFQAALIGLGAAAVQPLLDVLPDDSLDSVEREYAIRVLGEIGDKRAVDTLIGVLNREAPYADLMEETGGRELLVAVKALGKIGDAGAVEALIAILAGPDHSWADASDYVLDTIRAATEALGKIGDARAVEPLIAILADPDYQWPDDVVATLKRGVAACWRDVLETRLAAAIALGEIGDPRAVEPLIGVLDESELRSRWMPDSPITALGRIGDPRAVDPLIAVLATGDAREASQAAAAFGGIGDTRAVEPLIAALEHDDHEVTEAAVCALGEIGDPRARESLLAALEHNDSQVRVWAAEALHELGEPRAIAALIAMADPDYRWPDDCDDVYEARQAAVTVVGRIGDLRAVEPLIAALDDSIFRESAAEGLGLLGDTRAIPDLIKALGDEDWCVVRAAAYALSKINDPRSIEPLAELLTSDSEVNLRIQAALALAEREDTRAIPTLVDASIGALNFSRDLFEGSEFSEALEKLGREVDQPDA